MIEPIGSCSIVVVFAPNDDRIGLAANIDEAAVRAHRQPIGAILHQAAADRIDKLKRRRAGAKKSRTDIGAGHRGLFEFNLIMLLRGQISALGNDCKVAVKAQRRHDE